VIALRLGWQRSNGLERSPLWRALDQEISMDMDWITPTLVAIRVGHEINGYLPAAF
jgi:hypothetical protein